MRYSMAFKPYKISVNKIDKKKKKIQVSDLYPHYDVGLIYLYNTINNTK